MSTIFSWSIAVVYADTDRVVMIPDGKGFGIVHPFRGDAATREAAERSDQCFLILYLSHLHRPGLKPDGGHLPCLPVETNEPQNLVADLKARRR